MIKHNLIVVATALLVALATHPIHAQILTDEAREPLIDLLASERIERIDFISTSFDGAIENIELAVDTMLETTKSAPSPPEETVRALVEVIWALDGFKPRRDGYNFDTLKLIILDRGDARQLGELVSMTTVMILEDPASRAAVQVSGKALFRGITLDSEEGISPLEQLLDHVRKVNKMSHSDRGKFFR